MMEAPIAETSTSGSKSPAAPRKRFVGRSSQASTSSRPTNSSALLAAAHPTDPLLLSAIEHLLPASYNFEIPKTIAQIRKNGAARVALQMPEGLLMFGCAIVDIIERFSGAECVIMGDVTYGACCIDDYTARALGCDMMVHYGHSCLVPVDTTTIKTLYVFVEISVDRAHLAATVRLNFPACIPSSNSATTTSRAALEIAIEPSPDVKGPNSTISQKPTKIALVGTIQFVAAVQGLKADLEADPSADQHSQLLAIEDTPSSSPDAVVPLAVDSSSLSRAQKFEAIVPQVKPLSPGEILGCTAPRLPADTEALLYVGDGRFHLESIMIANPTIPAFRYDPYTKRLTRELYEHDEMRRSRANAISEARESLTASGSKQDVWAVVLGTLGRQGNLRVLRSVTQHLAPTSSSSSVSSRQSGAPFIPMLLSELSPAKLALFTGVSTFVQTSCPRLSIDWGYAFPKPLLSPYEASVALGVSGARGWSGIGLPAVMEGTHPADATQGDYPMDFYADNSMGSWTPRHGMGIKKGGAEKGRPVPRSKRT